MPGSSHPGRPLRRVAASAATALYLLVAVVAPVVHAQLEDLVGAVTVEETHSVQCDRIHSETVCPASGAFRALPGGQTPTIESPAVVPAVRRTSPADPRVSSERSAAHLIRGPPTV